MLWSVAIFFVLIGKVIILGKILQDSFAICE